jgi:UDP-N-acetylglucosamine--N-acetylmuramyl-(pentapeptide) pyrophosphoryl-undecaprenol N-acetylglucosamine transferase
LAVPLVRRVYLAFPIEGRSGGRYLVTGRPVPPPATDVARDPATVLVFGGSLGARRLNDAAAAAWGGADPGFRVVHITGERDAERYREAGRPWYEVLEYTNELGRLLAAATVAVARAGGSVFEVAAAGTPALLVPSPNVTADHQSANARHLERAGAAVVVADADLTAERLDAEVRALLADPARLAAMGEAARAWSRPDAARVIADDLRRLVPA